MADPGVPAYSVSSLDAGDVDGVVQLIKAEGWAVAQEDIHALLSMSPPAILKVAKSDDGTIISICIASVTDIIAFVAWYLTRDTYRGRGVGTAVWKSLVNNLPKDTTLALLGVNDMIAKYGQHGLTEGGPRYYYDERIYTSPDVQHDFLGPHGIKTVPYSEHYADAFHLYDNEICPVNRHKYIDYYWKTSYVTLGAVNADGKVCGIACLRKYPNGFYRVCPLYADNNNIAHALLAKLLEEVPQGSRVSFYTLVDAVHTTQLWNRPGFECCEINDRERGQLLYDKKPIALPVQKIYALAGSFIPVV